MSNRGYFTLAQNSNTDYVRMAYLLALSLKVVNEDNNLSIGITKGQVVPEKYKQVFDEIIDIPWTDEAKDQKWKLANEWKVYHMSPYQHTIKLDTDIIFPVSTDYYWELLKGKPFFSSTVIRSCDGNITKNDYYRKDFTRNNIKPVYSALTYFEKCDEAKQVFELIESIFKDWNTYRLEFTDILNEDYPITTDMAYGLALKIIDNPEYISNKEWFSFIHAKSQLQTWNDKSDDWILRIPFNVNNKLDVKIGHCLQTYPLHYHIKEFASDRLIEQYEKELGI